MKTKDLLQHIDIPRHKLYYLEQKGYVIPQRIPMGDLEAREFSEADVRLVQAIWKYLKQGFKHKVAYQKALDKTESRSAISQRARRRNAA